MKKNLRNTLSILAVLAVLTTSRGLAADTSVSSTALTQDDLQNRIQLKTKELDQVNAQIQAVQQSLETAQGQRLTLQKQLQNLQSKINQLTLGIKSDEIASEKLGLEITSLNEDIGNIENSISVKQQAIVKILQEIQKGDGDNPLLVFLKNNTLADSVLETQSLNDLRSQLATDVDNLTVLRQNLTGKAQKVTDKKGEIDLHKNNLAVRNTIVQDQKAEQQVILAQTKDKESAYQQQLDTLKKQQNAIADEIDSIEEQLRSTFNVNVLPLKKPGILSWPIEGAIRITQHYGEISYLYRGKPHNGMDIGAPIGTPVLAAADGVVMAAGNNDASRWRKYQYGKYVLIKHPNNLATLYAHLSGQNVREGDSVKRGQLIGYSGDTGYATGPHLHLGLYWAPSIIMKAIPPAAGLVPVGVTINPEDYL